jgi:hypothetical protein
MKNFAFGAVILGLISVVAEDLMAHLVQEGALPTIVVIPSDQSLKRQANTDPTGEPNSHVTKGVRSIGIDMSATGAIPSSIPTSPCDHTSRTVLVTRSIGIEGTTSTQIATPETPCDQSHK